MSRAFNYSPLHVEVQEIRLIDIGLIPQLSEQNVPRIEEHTLSCSIRHVSLSTEPKPVYETVSYCWGDPDLAKAILVDGRTLRVPYSAFEILTRLILPDRPRSLWIDAVCIDQGNEEERNQQVSQMRYIYRYGTANLIYLGDDHPLTARALGNLYALHREFTWDFLRTDQTIFDLMSPPQKCHGPLRTVIDAEALSTLYSSQWFTRLWVFQEAILAQRNIVIRGTFEFDLEELLEVAVALRYPFFDLVPEPLWKAQGFIFAQVLARFRRKYRESRGAGIDLESLLSATKSLQSFDPRDRVFGILGIARIDSIYRIGQAAQQLLTPDYSKPLFEVFRDATRFCVVQDGGLGILRELRSHYGNTRASWALTANTFVDRSHDHYFSPTSITLLNVAKRDISFANLPDRCEDPDKLSVYGFIVGIVSECSPVLDPKGPCPAAPLGFTFSTLRDFLSTCIDIGKRSGNTIVDLGNALTASRDHLQVRWSADEQFETLPMLQELVCEEAAGRATIFRSTNPDDRTRLTPLVHSFAAMRATCKSGRLFLTKSGALGIAPAVTQPGDIVAFLYSSRNPCILRPKEENVFSFLAECYVNTIRSEEDVERCRVDNAASAQWYTLA